MTQTMSCRGPDASGTWLDHRAALGHRRLAVIDLPGGAQPMTGPTPDGDVTMVYSGEAYDFTDLREELRAAGHRFDTDSDTEVVLHGYLERGDALVDRLNGMYASAIWDARTERLVMIRDRMGVEPSYYHPTDDGVVFGSEPKAILANPLVPPVVGAYGLRELFSFLKSPGVAVWEGMAEARPGEIITLDRKGLHRRTYWRLRPEPHTDRTEQTVAQVRELLDDIVKRQLVADVPRCTLLSGGPDSSALTALAALHLAPAGGEGPQLRRGLLRPGEALPGDGRLADPGHPLCARRRGAPGQRAPGHRPGRRRALCARRAAGRSRRPGPPVGIGDRDNSLYLLFSAVRRHSTVALSGESADEVFGGYPWFHDERREADTFPWTAGDPR
ncbi:hypothetical protein GCM10023082_24210 [Streptomyces tremellae]|uniref:asparagine synthase (glutamine-hydrolyzing) n=1 Tax=Streptomyces tremellae TaxID=1124239 RepID=A0ABP7EVQ2_9ACTN